MNPTKTTIHFRPLESFKKTSPAPLAKSTQAAQVLLTTSYPSELGILRTSVCRCDEKRRVCLLPLPSTGPLGFPASLFLTLPVPRKPVKQPSPSHAVGAARRAVPSPIPNGRGPAPPSQLCPGHSGMGIHLPCTVTPEKMLMQTSILFKILFLLNFLICSS